MKTYPYKPMLAKKTEAGKVPMGDYAYELKWDGIRAIVVTDDDRRECQIFSRSGRDITRQFPELVDPLWSQLERGVYDCEIVVFDPQGRPSFPMVTSRLHLGDDVGRKRGSVDCPATLMVFDVLEVEGESWVEEVWDNRRRFLEETVEDCSQLKLSAVSKDGNQLMEYAKQNELEGIMAKKRSDVYSPGKRRASWTKVKCQTILDVQIVGYTDGLGKRDGLFGALILQDMSGADCGRVGTGFTDYDLERITTLLEAVGSKDRTQHGKEWVNTLKRPVPAEVQAMYRTSDGALREPVFRELK